MLVTILHIYRQIFFEDKFRVMLIVMMSLISQIFLLMSLLLPWQVLQVLATGHTRLKSLWVTNTAPIMQLVILSGVITLSFAAYLRLNWQVKSSTEKLAVGCIERLGKTKLMVNHHSIAVATMSVIIRSLSMIVNCIVFMSTVALIYPKIMVATLAYMLILGFGIVTVYRRYEQNNTLTKLQGKLQQFILIFVNLGIASAFFVIIFDYTQQTLPPLFLIFMSVLVLRQALIAFINIFVYLIGIVKRQRNINLLFLSQENQLRLSIADEFEHMFYQQNLTSWLPDWIVSKSDSIFKSCYKDNKERVVENFDILTVTCQECKLVSQATVAYMVITVKFFIANNDKLFNDEQTQKPLDYDPEVKERWLLLKCYHPSKTSYAKHEADFLLEKQQVGIVPEHISNSLSNTGDNIKDIPVESMGSKTNDSSAIPELIDTGKLPWCDYLLMEFDATTKWLNAVERKPYYHDLRVGIYQTSVNSDTKQLLIGKYERTYDDLSQRMLNINWNRLNYLTEHEKQGYRLDELIGQWSYLTERVLRLPKLFMLESLATPRLAISNQGPIIYCWQGWVYDFFGSYWPLSTTLSSEVADVIDVLERKGVKSISLYIASYNKEILIEDAVLAAKLHEFCRRLNLKNDIGAMNMIKGLLESSN